ncbi:MAG: HAMP domain-containing protein [Myxococcales bacterium]|nr:HAMP domain-containing protein [Myxococcales bacterium]
MTSSSQRFGLHSIRFRLMIGAVAVILLANTGLAVFSLTQVSEVLLDEVQTRVRLDLNAAHQVYGQATDRIAHFLRALSMPGGSLSRALEQHDLSALAERLPLIAREAELDMVTAMDAEGRVVFRSANPGVRGDSLRELSVVRRALSEQRLVSGTIIIPRALLEREGPALAERAFFELLKTPQARPPAREFEADGMALAAAAPLRGPDGRITGLVLGANLLSRRFDIVDRIKEVVFQAQTFQGKDIGTATIFRHDLRISTNVRNRDGSRAIGTLLSAPVAERVLDRGEIFADRAFVVNDWYISAYEPIRDPDGEVIGILYVGLLEAPFARVRAAATGGFLATVAVTTLASLLLLFFLTRQVLKPIGRVLSMSRKVVDGDLGARVLGRYSGEMGLLVQAVNAMAEAIARREAELERMTRAQIGQSEKLASIGRLAAGIAHEINNPLTGVLTFAHLLREKTHLEGDRGDLDVIIRETTRVREIVRGLLDFARESPSRQEILDLNSVIRATLKLVRSQKEFSRVVIQEALADVLPSVRGDRNQLQQVLLNLSLNACEAMPQGGTLSVRSFNDGARVAFSVADTGCGIRPEHMEKIFEPFFTTKPIGKGTGLGLSVSYGIVQQHRGSIEVHSELERGTVFTVYLPAEASGEGAHSA